MSNSIPTDRVIGVKLITGIDLIGVKLDLKPTSKKNVYEKSIQLTFIPSQSGAEVKFIPFNLFDSTNHRLPYRDISVDKTQVLYEYIPDINLINSYLNIIVTNVSTQSKGH